MKKKGRGPRNKLSFLIECAIEFENEQAQRRLEEQAQSEEPPEQSESKDEDENEPVKPRSRRNKAARVPNSFKETSSVASTIGRSDESIPRHQKELSVDVASSDESSAKVSRWDSWVESTVDCSEAVVMQSLEPPYQGLPLSPPITQTISECSSERSRRNIIKSMRSIASDYSDNEKKSQQILSQRAAVSSDDSADDGCFKMCALCDESFRPISCDYSKISISIGGLKRRFCEYFDINTADFNPNLETFLRRDKYPFCPECLVLVNNLYRRAEQFRRAMHSYKTAKSNVLSKAVNAAELRKKIDNDADPYYFVKLKVLQTNLLLENDLAESITRDEDIKGTISEDSCLNQTAEEFQEEEEEQEFLEEPIDFTVASGEIESDATEKIHSPSSRTAGITSSSPETSPKRKRQRCDSSVSSEVRRNFTSPPSSDGVNKSVETSLLEKLDETSTDNVLPSSLSPSVGNVRKSAKKVRSKKIHRRPQVAFPRGKREPIIDWLKERTRNVKSGTTTYKTLVTANLQNIQKKPQVKRVVRELFADSSESESDTDY